MRKFIMVIIALTALFSSCKNSSTDSNPFFTQWETPYGVPPFDQIKNEHYLPAIEEGMRLEKEEINAIINSIKAPTFENTILAYDNTGEFLRRVSMTLNPILRTDIDSELEQIEEQYLKLATAHSSDIALNPMLFIRIKSIYDNRANLQLDAEQARLLDRIYRSFERSGANLPEIQKERFREIDSQLSQLTTQFGNNIRREQSEFRLIVENKEELAGLSELNISAAADKAASLDMAGKWVFTLDKPSMLPFLQYAESRELRKKLYNGYLMRGNNDNGSDNKKVIDEIVNLRLERSNMLGFDNHAAYVVDQNMAKTPEAVFALLNELWTPALKRAKEEKREMETIMHREGIQGEIELWDWWYYAEKLRAEKYDLNEEELRPYFALDAVLEGMFQVTTRLWGVTYKEITATVPLYGEENRVFEVKDRDGSLLGVVYFDFHPRDSKGVGAWCTHFRSQSYKAGEKITPVISIVCNFTKASGDQPALLTLDEVKTMYHEYGHGLHGLFADVKYNGLNRVERDFVELPSQVMENWAFEPEVLRNYAKHYKTGDPLPEEQIQKIANSGLFNQGFGTVEYTAAALLDMEYHTVNDPTKIDANQFERDFAAKYHTMPQIEPRYRSTYFNHIFSGGYSAGYYVYIWAEVLDADAFAAFKESGDIYNPTIAEAFRRELLSRGGSSDGGTLYRNFRGKDASKDYLLKNRGLN